jgi:hypothetical protein
MKLELPDIPKTEQTPVVKGLLVIIEQLIEHSQKQKEYIEVMKDEIRIFKGEKKRPKCIFAWMLITCSPAVSGLL